MGSLAELISEDRNVHLITTNSSMAEMYVYDVLKKSCNATLESVYEINKRSEFQAMIEIINMQPYMADKWLFILEYDKVKALIKQYIHIFDIDSACFLVKCKKYADFKEFKDMYKKVNDLYLSVIRSGDVQFLLKDFQLSPNMVDFIGKSYYRDPEKIFILIKELKNGLELKSSKDVVKVCGASSSSVVSFTFLMLNKPPETKKGLSKVLKKRIQVANDLIAAYGISSFKNFLTASVKDILDIKTLYMEGIIYKTIRDLPDCYDEKKLSRYNIYLNKILFEIPYDMVLNLYFALKKSGKWYNKLSMIEFIYDYYGGCCDEDISQL